MTGRCYEVETCTILLHSKTAGYPMALHVHVLESDNLTFESFSEALVEGERNDRFRQLSEIEFEHGGHGVDVF